MQILGVLCSPNIRICDNSTGTGVPAQTGQGPRRGVAAIASITINYVPHVHHANVARVHAWPIVNGPVVGGANGRRIIASTGEKGAAGCRMRGFFFVGWENYDTL